MRSTLVKLLFLFTITLTFSQQLKVDTLLARKDFFLTDNYGWKNESYNRDYGTNKVRIISQYKNQTYTILFNPIDKSKNYKGNFGKIIYRFDNNKNLNEVKVYFLDNNDCYLYFTNESKGKFDIILFSQVYERELNYYFPFENLKYLPLDQILSLVELNQLENKLLLDYNDSITKKYFISKIISPSIGDYEEDSAINQYGDFVKINDGKTIENAGLNCSGFSKAIIDNYIRFHDEEFNYLSIETLKKKTERNSTVFANYEIDFDPYFGLDWVNNLAIEFNNKINFSKVMPASEITEHEKSFYYKNRGFNLENLQEIIYQDQLINNHSFYIIVLNKFRTQKPIIPEYYHIAIIVPYAEKERFYMKVYESAAETNFSSLVNNQLPTYFFYDDFQKKFVETLNLSDDDKAFMQKSYIVDNNKRFYYKKRNLSNDDAVKVSKILTKIEFRDRKVMIYRFPISTKFLMINLPYSMTNDFYEKSIFPYLSTDQKSFFNKIYLSDKFNSNFFLNPSTMDEERKKLKNILVDIQYHYGIDIFSNF